MPIAFQLEILGYWPIKIKDHLQWKKEVHPKYSKYQQKVLKWTTLISSQVPEQEPPFQNVAKCVGSYVPTQMSRIEVSSHHPQSQYTAEG